METHDVEFKFYNVYSMAHLVERSIEYPHTLVEVNWCREAFDALIKPQKISLMHQYIYAIISTESRRDYRRNSDLYNDDLYVDDLNHDKSFIREMYDTFEEYGISFDFADRSKLDHLDDPFYAWFLSQEEQFESLWEKFAGEVFYLLYANRNFLLRFNLSLADFLQNGEVIIPKEYLDKKGTLRRASHIPAWLKRAVFFRDNGRCVFCRKDLSGLLSTDRILHYDHIVPLNLWGSNDPSNFQLLCSKCNLEKSGDLSAVGYQYSTWW